MKKILIVDDSETSRSQLKTALNDGGYEVVEGFNGMKGLEMMEAEDDIQLIITDINMPELNGIEMCTKINERENWRHIPIIILTSEFSQETKKRAKELGVKVWVTKPFREQSLLACIEQLISKS